MLVPSPPLSRMFLRDCLSSQIADGGEDTVGDLMSQIRSGGIKLRGKQEIKPISPANAEDAPKASVAQGGWTQATSPQLAFQGCSREYF